MRTNKPAYRIKEVKDSRGNSKYYPQIWEIKEHQVPVPYLWFWSKIDTITSSNWEDLLPIMDNIKDYPIYQSFPCTFSPGWTSSNPQKFNSKGTTYDLAVLTIHTHKLDQVPPIVSYHEVF